MAVFRVFALSCAAALLAIGPALQAQNEPSPPPAYPDSYGSGSPGYHPVDPGYLPPAAAPADGSAAHDVPPPYDAPPPAPPLDQAPQPYNPPAAPVPTPHVAPTACGPAQPGQTNGQANIREQDALAAAEGVFGKGAKGLASVIERIFKDQGQPNAYIAGREAGGAFVVGVRYGSGTMCHQIEGDSKVYWTGPSIGFDAGADANKVFVLVYNLHDSQELFRRYPATEGRAYLVGGFSASVLQRGDVVLVPIRLGVGVRLGVNAGYMSFSKKSRWLPF